MCIFIQKQGQKSSKHNKKNIFEVINDSLSIQKYLSSFSHFPVWTSSFFSLTVK